MVVGNSKGVSSNAGKVRIRFDYTNKSSLKVEVNGKTVEVSTPFVVCSAMFLSSDNFSNIEVTNGKTVEMDDQNIVIGYAMPGLSDSLQLKNYEVTEDVDIPEYVELTADVTDFHWISQQPLSPTVCSAIWIRMT